MLPSTLARDDGTARQVRAAFRSQEVRSCVVVPRSPVASVIGSALTSNSPWRRIELDDRSLRIDNRLFQGERIGVIPVTGEHHKGPFALDLASHFLHPVDRAKLLISRDRPRLVAGVAAQAPVGLWIIGSPVGDTTLWLTTDDIIAAELWALVLAERFLDSTLELQGSWEDSTVQRATELDLGVRIPSEMQIRIGGTGDLPAEIARLIVTCCRRLGMEAPTGVS